MFLELIALFEEYQWEYIITLEGHIQIELGNEYYDVNKHNKEELQELLDEAKSW